MSLKSGRNVIAELVAFCCMSWTLCTCALVLGEAVICWVIIKKVAYTEIDYSTYLEQAAMVTEDGVYEYGSIRGAQGPLVYPAGHVWLYAAVGDWASGSIAAAQRLFGALYVADALVMARVYAGALAKGAFPPVCLAALALSRRAHSVFCLRLFNDGPVALLSHGSVLLFMGGTDALGCVLFSLAVSVKMNALLYAPAVYLCLAARHGHRGAWLRVVGLCGGVQALVALPFLLRDPLAYVANAFNLGRGFKHKWSVNFKWVPCDPLPSDRVTALADCDGPFASAAFKVASLGLHAGLLLALADRSWLARRGGFVAFFRDPRRGGPFAPAAAAKMLLAANFVGVACARSLHFQFCVWYANSLPLLLATTRLAAPLKVALLVAVEAAWNPWGASETSSPASAALLTAAHGAILLALLATRTEAGGAAPRPPGKRD